MQIAVANESHKPNKFITAKPKVAIKLGFSINKQTYKIAINGIPSKIKKPNS